MRPIGHAPIVVALGIASLLLACKTPQAAPPVSSVKALTGDVDKALSVALPDICTIAKNQKDLLKSEGFAEAAKSCSTPILKLTCVIQKPVMLDAAVAATGEAYQSLDEASEHLADKDRFVAEYASRMRKPADETLDYLMQDPGVAKIMAVSKNEAEMREGVKEQFKLELESCLTAMERVNEEIRAEMRTDPEMAELAADLRSSFWSSVLSTAIKTGIQAGQVAIASKLFRDQAAKQAAAAKQAGKTVVAPRLNLATAAAVAAWMCSAGAQLAGSFMESARDQQVDQCLAYSKHSFASQECFNALSSACGTILGAVDFRQWGVEPQGEVGKTILEIANFGAWSVCVYGGRSLAAATGGAGYVVPIACGMANTAANWIRQTATTGSNDVAECFGSTKIGGCLGGIYGSNGWASQERIAPPETIEGPDGRPWVIRSCCECQRKYYQEVGEGMFGRRSLFVKQETVMSVIQRGTFEEGNCARMESVEKEWTPAKPVDGLLRAYYKNDECTRTTVHGPSCVGDKKDEHTSALRKWDFAKRRPAEKVYFLRNPSTTTANWSFDGVNETFRPR